MREVQRRVKPYIQLMRLDRPIGILLLLWPTLSALWIAAEGLPDITVLVVFILGVILMRSAGCASMILPTGKLMAVSGELRTAL